MAQALQDCILRPAQAPDEAFELPGSEEQPDERVELRGHGGLDGLLVPGRAFGPGHEFHKVVGVLAQMLPVFRPGPFKRLVAASEPDEELALEADELVVRCPELRDVP